SNRGRKIGQSSCRAGGSRVRVVTNCRCREATESLQSPNGGGRAEPFGQRREDVDPSLLQILVAKVLIDSLKLLNQLFVADPVGIKDRLAILDTLDVCSVNELQVQLFGNGTEALSLVSRGDVGPIDVKGVGQPASPEDAFYRLRALLVLDVANLNSACRSGRA